MSRKSSSRRPGIYKLRRVEEGHDVSAKQQIYKSTTSNQQGCWKNTNDQHKRKKTDAREVLPPEQFEFKGIHSVEQPLRITEIAAEGISQHNTTWILLLDTERAFDCINNSSQWMINLMKRYLQDTYTHTLGTKLAMFADYTTINSTFRMEAAARHNKLQDWLVKWKIKTNVTKTKASLTWAK